MGLNDEIELQFLVSGNSKYGGHCLFGSFKRHFYYNGAQTFLILLQLTNISSDTILWIP